MAASTQRSSTCAALWRREGVRDWATKCIPFGIVPSDLAPLQLYKIMLNCSPLSQCPFLSLRLPLAVYASLCTAQFRAWRADRDGLANFSPKSQGFWHMFTGPRQIMPDLFEMLPDILLVLLKPRCFLIFVLYAQLG